MTMNMPSITIFDTDERRVRRLAEHLQGTPGVSVTLGNGPEVNRREDLDAFLITLMMAERYGASPPFPAGRSIVIRTGAGDVARGLPPFMIAGVSIDLREPRDHAQELRLFLSAGLDAVDEHNASNAGAIRKVGVLADVLCAGNLTESDAAAIVSEVVASRS